LSVQKNEYGSVEKYLFSQNNDLQSLSYTGTDQVHCSSQLRVVDFPSCRPAVWRAILLAVGYALEEKDD
jgi:hypothetical protein